MKYIGILPKSSVKPNYKTKFHHEEKKGGKTVKYYECWIETAPKPAFGDNLDKAKIRDLDKIFNKKKKKY